MSTAHRDHVELPVTDAAVGELAQVLRPGSQLVVRELFGDPHMVTERALRAGRQADAAALRAARGPTVRLLRRARSPRALSSPRTAASAGLSTASPRGSRLRTSLRSRRRRGGWAG